MTSTNRQATSAEYLRRGLSELRPFLLLGCIYLCFLLFSLLLPPAQRIRFDIGAPNDTLIVADMLAAETVPESGRTFRWTNPEGSQIWAHGTDRGIATLDLELFGFVSETQAAQTITLTRGPAAPLVFPVMPGWRTYHMLLPRTSPWDAPLPVTLQSERFRGPTSDAVPRGVPIDRVGFCVIRPDLIPGRTQMLAWGITLLFWIGWRCLHHPWIAHYRRVAALRWMPAALLLIIAILLTVWDRMHPYTLAWLLPPMPWILAIATLALVRTSRQLREHPWYEPLRRPWIGTGLLASGCLLMFTQVAMIPGFALALIGMACLPEPTEQRGAATPRSLPEYPILLGIFVLALALRLYDIQNLPYGLWRDEARHLMVAERILTEPDYRPIYIPTGGIDLPGLGLYPFVLGLWAWGIEPWSARPITALAGALTILPLYGLARNLFGRGIVPLTAAAFLAISSWHIAISRFSFPTVFDPLLQLTGLWLIATALNPNIPPQVPITGGLLRRSALLNRRTAGLLIFAGFCFGLAAQTYHTGRLGIGFAGLLTLALLWKNREARHQEPKTGTQTAARRANPYVQVIGSSVVALILLGCGALVSAGPLIGYALQNPKAFNQRVGAVSIFSDGALRGQAPLAALDDAFGRHLLMFNARGDQNGRHHAPDRPLLDLFAGMGLLAGIEYLLRQRNWSAGFMLGALALGILPSMLSVDSPHAMRAIDAIGFACILAAFGWYRMAECLAPSTRRTLPMLAGAVTIALVLNVWTYFILMPPDRAAWTAFYPVHTKIGAALRDIAATDGSAALEQVYIPRSLAANEVLVYLTLNLPVQTFDGTQLSAPARPGALFFFSGYNYKRDSTPLIPALYLDSTPALIGPPLPDGSGPAWVAYRKTR